MNFPVQVNSNDIYLRADISLKTDHITAVPDISQPLSNAPIRSSTLLSPWKKLLLSTLNHTGQCGQQEFELKGYSNETVCFTSP